MFDRSTDREWEKFGQRDAYYGVVSHAKYRKDNLSADRKSEFFQSGEEHVAHVLERLRAHMGGDVDIRRAVDFGCGVGRLAIPLAKVAGEVTGLDVSESMLQEAARNAAEQSLANIRWAKSDDGVSALSGEYDFIHSYIVFQHIPVARGERIFAELLAHLSPGGMGAVHFSYGSVKRGKHVALFVQKHVPFAGNVANLIRGRGLFEPQMQMNMYSLNRLSRLLQQAGVQSCHIDFTDHRGELGAMLYFRKGTG